MSSFANRDENSKILKAITAPEILKKKNRERIACLTAYDYPTAKWCDDAGVDLILVGDSVATVLYGEPNTLSATMERMLAHTKAVTRAVKRSLVVADLPFLSYQVSQEQAILNAGRMLAEGGAQAVKLEGGIEMETTISAIVRAGIPVMAHIGLTPQSVHAMGGYRTHGKTPDEKSILLENAKAVERAGAFCVVLECVEESIAKLITRSISIPTIGIGTGAPVGEVVTDGQILVTQDLLGITEGKVPRFVHQTANLKVTAIAGIEEYVLRTRSGRLEQPPPSKERPHEITD